MKSLSKLVLVLLSIFIFVGFQSFKTSNNDKIKADIVNLDLDASPKKLQKMALKGEMPIGIEALDFYAKIKGNSFEKNVQFSNNWIESHVVYYEKTRDRKYKEYMKESIEGGGPEKGLGMRGWISDKKNVARWDKDVAATIGEDGYARLIALNAAFKPGSDSHFKMIYGGERLYDQKNDQFLMNSRAMKDAKLQKDYVQFNSRKPSYDDMFKTLLVFADKIRTQTFNFYADFRAGKVSEEQVATFNKAYVVVGGCAMASTDVMNDIKGLRYLKGLNYMAATLTELGYPVN
ncbi:MAG: hypothetical protein R3E32_27310 [Chitinophagales bacterium]